MAFSFSRIVCVFLIFLAFAPVSFGQHEDGKEGQNNTDEKFDMSTFVMHHISDAYSFHIIGDIEIPLPVIIYQPGVGFNAFLSSALHHPDEQSHLVKGKYYYHHGKIIIPKLDAHGHIVKDSTGHIAGLHAATLLDVFSGNTNVYYDFSITKTVFGILLSIGILLLIFLPMAKRYKKKPNHIPRKLFGALEPIILFVQNDVAKELIGQKHYSRYVPLLLTLFFFIWLNNLMGLIPIFPGSTNVTGNIAITFTMAIIALIVQLVASKKAFWMHIVWPPNMPIALKPLLIVIEFMGIFTKPFALMIRLFANITAGHIVLISLISITFLVQSYVVGVAMSLFSAAMLVLEIIVGAIQAYIFVLITAIMIGMAVEEPHGHKEKESEIPL